MEHEFTKCIKAILEEEFGQATQDIFDKSPLIQYLNFKTRSATRGSKARGSFANFICGVCLSRGLFEEWFC